MGLSCTSLAQAKRCSLGLTTCSLNIALTRACEDIILVRLKELALILFVLYKIVCLMENKYSEIA